MTAAEALNVEDRHHPHHLHGWWWKTLLAGLGLWIVTIAGSPTVAEPPEQGALPPQ